MTKRASLKYTSVGGNRHPSAADWSPAFGGLLAYGAGNSIALWQPLSSNHRGVVALLNGHADSVKAVRILQPSETAAIIISGSDDKTIRAWKIDAGSLSTGCHSSTIVGQHDAAVTVISISSDARFIVSGAADSTVKIWSAQAIAAATSDDQQPLQQIKLKVMPLAVAIHYLSDNHYVLAIGGSHSSIHVYASQSDNTFAPVATLTGHAGWIRALAFTTEHSGHTSDLLLASASQDRFIRLWRIHLGDALPVSKPIDNPSSGLLGKSMSTKIHQFSVNSSPATITFEALLLGHEDWIYTARWQRRNGKLQMLSASADSSLAIWESDPQSGIWVCVSRLGEISAQKGSTTATGSAGGFWIGLWSPDGKAVASLGRTGSWRLWLPEDEDTWVQSVGCGGHVRSVNDIAWAPNGSYLLSASADQTTRLHAQWKRKDQTTWHEFARPQIHGYDLNCIDTISASTFVSGADEKPIRAFQEPATVAAVLSDLCQIDNAQTDLPPAANIPVLGLSNKEIDSTQDTNGTETADSLDQPYRATAKSLPPNEDNLSRELLFPEIHKIYGHGLEISTLAVSTARQRADGAQQVLASACRASSIDHAVIRLHETSTWREYCAPLKAHTLTVTSLRWSPDAKYLLSTSRDRMFSVFEHKSGDAPSLQMVAHVKGHTRMILGCAWAPLDAGYVFVTAGRDKCAKVWRVDDSTPDKCLLLSTITTPQPVTAVAVRLDDADNPSLIDVVVGLENGSIMTCAGSTSAGDKSAEYDAEPIQAELCPTKAITKLLWRPSDSKTNGELAISSEDSSLRILSL